LITGAAHKIPGSNTLAGPDRNQQCLLSNAKALVGCSGLSVVCARGLRWQHRITSINLTYLGAGGFLMSRNTDEIATGPFFSNPDIFDVALFPIKSNVDAVERYLPEGPELKAILVGRGHYDHLMDIPTVVRLRAPNATIYASESGAFLLASVIPMDAFETVDKRAWPDKKPQDRMTVPGTAARVRLLAITSKHAPHAFGITLFHGEYLKARPLPSRAGDWLDGPTHSFLIEFRGADGNPEFRVHYQGTATDGGIGMPPKHLEADGGQVPYTILLPTVASSGNLSNYPERLVERLNPDYTVLGHWEDFFLSFSKDRETLRSARLTNVAEFIKKLKVAMGSSAYTLSAPLTKIRFARHCLEA